MVDIEIHKTVGERVVFTAEIKGSPETATKGFSETEAIGELVKRHPDRFGVGKVETISNVVQAEAQRA